MTHEIMMDAMHVNAARIPQGTAIAAGYVTGSADVQWTADDWARFPSSGHVRIDQSPHLAAFAAGDADVADVEQEAGTVYQAVAGAAARKARGWMSWIYTSQANLAGVQKAVAAAHLTGHVQYWVADWALTEAEAAARLTGSVIAVQWASPSSNPGTVVPGGTLTLQQAGIDVSVAVTGWFAKKATEGVVVTAGLSAVPVVSADGKTWTATHG